MGGISTMSNGELLREVFEILQQEKDIPDLSPKAASRLTMAALVQMYQLYAAMKGKVDDTGILVSGLIKERTDRTERAKTTEETLRKVWLMTLGLILAAGIDIAVHFWISIK